MFIMKSKFLRNQLQLVAKNLISEISVKTSSFRVYLEILHIKITNKTFFDVIFKI